METNTDTDDLPLSFDVPDEMRSERLWGYFLNYKWWFVLGAGFLIMTNLQKFAIPLYIGHAVELMEQAAEGTTALAGIRTDLVWAASTIVFLAIGAAVARILSRIAIFNPGRYIEFNLRNDLYDKLTELTPAFFDPAPTASPTT
jgi:ATP-binding cassette subfamily B protein